METKTQASWEPLLTLDGFEYWCRTDDETVWRRRESSYNFINPDGTPNALRREGSLAWFRRAYGLTA